MVRDRYSKEINVHIVIPSQRTPSELKWSGEVVLDSDGSLHRRYGATSESLYLIRPDGYVGYRSQPAVGEKLDEYLKRMFIRRHAS